MFDDIVKALTLQIDVDDKNVARPFKTLQETVKNVSGEWSSWGAISNNISSGVAADLTNVVKGLTPYSVAVKAATLAWDGLKEGYRVMIEGGEFNEVATAFESVTAAAGVSAQGILASISRISEGTLGYAEIMKSTSKAIAAGFSEDQLSVIYTYAKRFSEATGASFTATAEGITQAVMSGRKKSLVGYGLALEDNENFWALLLRQTEKYGDGAFNFGDLITSSLASVANELLLIGRHWNETLEDAGIGHFFSEKLPWAIRETGEWIEWLGDGMIRMAVAVANATETTYRAATHPLQTIQNWWNGVDGPTEGFKETAKAMDAASLASNGLGTVWGKGESAAKAATKETKALADETRNLKKEYDGVIESLKKAEDAYKKDTDELEKLYKERDKLATAARKKDADEAAKLAASALPDIYSTKDGVKGAYWNAGKTGVPSAASEKERLALQQRTSTHNVMSLADYADASSQDTIYAKIAAAEEKLREDTRRINEALAEESLNERALRENAMLRSWDGFGSGVIKGYLSGDDAAAVAQRSPGASGAAPAGASGGGRSGSMIVQFVVDGAVMAEKIIDIATGKALSEGLITAGV